MFSVGKTEYNSSSLSPKEAIKSRHLEHFTEPPFAQHAKQEVTLIEYGIIVETRFAFVFHQLLHANQSFFTKFQLLLLAL